MRAGAICFSIGLFFFAGCTGNAPPPADPMLSGRIGDNCTVYFRHDALGMAAASAAGPTTDVHNNVDLQVSGKLLHVNAGWISVGVDKTEYTIPKEVILLVKMPSR